MKALTVRDLQDYLAHTYGDRGQETGMFMKLVEEIGELAEILNVRAGRKAGGEGDLKDELACELADVIHYTVAIAAICGIDLADTIVQKDKRAAVKYGHEIDLLTFIERQNDK